MARLKIQEVAKSQDLTLSRLQAAVNRAIPAEHEPVAMGTIRRYWYGTQDGKASGDAIRLVDIQLLGTIASVLNVPAAELLDEKAA